MGCLKLERNTLLRIAHTSNSERSGEAKYHAGLYKYKYNGKELQDELGLNMYDYGARNYDPALGRWMNMDPMAEKYFGASPYNYVLNSPVNSIDPDGMDVYLLTESGKTILALKEKDKKTDTMYAVSNSSITDITSPTGTRESSPSIFDMKDTNGDGQFSKEDGVTVKSGLIGQLGKASNKGDGSYLSTSEYSKENENNYLSLFKYISDNSLENEFSLHFFNENGQNKIQLGTFYENAVSPGASGKTKSYHNHSDTDLVDERMSMGDNGRGRPDYSHQANDFNRANSAQISHPNYVYFGKSHRLYNVTKDNIIYIQKINNSNDLKAKK
jgi:RHS repeat-associated protein